MSNIPEIKICGITSTKEAEVLIEEKVDYAGLVLFFEKSKRNNTLEQAADIVKFLKEREAVWHIKKVAVVVSPTKEQIKQIEQMGFEYIQVHGELAKEAFDAIGIPMIRAVYGKDEELLKRIKGCPKIEALLFDGLVPGSGEVFDWSLLENVRSRLEGWNPKLILAGGLNARNVKEAIEAVKPHAVDVSSGVEFNRERIGKDPEKIREFVRLVRGC